MLTQADKQQIEGRGMTVAQVEHQLEQIREGFPFLKLESLPPLSAKAFSWQMRSLSRKPSTSGRLTSRQATRW